MLRILSLGVQVIQRVSAISPGAAHTPPVRRFVPLGADRWARLTHGQGGATDALFPGRLSAMLARRRALCLDLAAVSPRDMVLDLGCGVGHYREPVLQRKASWVGLDCSSEMLSYAKRGELEGAHLLQGDLCHLPFATASASLCLCAGVLDYLSAEALLPALKEVFRVLKPGGRLVLTCNEAWWGKGLRRLLPMSAPSWLRGSGRTYHHLRSLPALLREAGLALVEEQTIAGGPFSPATRIFLCRKRSAPCVSAATTVQSWRRI